MANKPTKSRGSTGRSASLREGSQNKPKSKPTAKTGGKTPAKPGKR